MTRNRRLAALACLICLLISTPVAASPQISVYSWFDEIIAFVSEIFGSTQEPTDAAERPAFSPSVETFRGNAASTVDLYPQVEPVGGTSAESEDDAPTANFFPEVEPIG